MRKKRIHVTLCVIWMALCSTNSAAGTEITQSLTIPNVELRNPLCRILLPSSLKCEAESCSFPAPEGARLKNIEINFSCISKDQNNGFEKPPPYAKVKTIRAKNSVGNLSITDGFVSDDGVRMRDVYFCLYGKQNTLCGNAKTLVLDDKRTLDASSSVKKIAESIRLIESIVP